MSKSPRASDHSEFRPLTLPQVKTPVQEPCEPVDWFQVIAPILESPAAPKRQDRRAPAAPGSARTVTFGDVDDFARQELQRKRDVLAQPKEVVEMIAVTARDSQRIVDEAREEAKRILKEARDWPQASDHVPVCVEIEV